MVSPILGSRSVLCFVSVSGLPPVLLKFELFCLDWMETLDEQIECCPYFERTFVGSKKTRIFINNKMDFGKKVIFQIVMVFGWF